MEPRFWRTLSAHDRNRQQEPKRHQDRHLDRRRLSVGSDGGQTWQVSNTGVKAYFMPNQYPEFGQCVHKIARHPKKKNLFFLQNHHGVYKSSDGAVTWKEIENRAAVEFRFWPNGQRQRFGIYRAAAGGWSAIYARGQASRLSHPRRGQKLGAADQRPAAKACVRGHLPRRCGVDREQHLFWNKERKAFRLDGRRRFVEDDRGLAA